jgi:hypothetical protein
MKIEKLLELFFQQSPVETTLCGNGASGLFQS